MTPFTHHGHKWNGDVPRFMGGSSAVPFVDVDKVINQSRPLEFQPTTAVEFVR